MDKKKNANTIFTMRKIENIFQHLDWQISHYNCYRWDVSVTKDALIKKRETLLETIENIGYGDLLILYYANHIGLSKQKIMQAFQEWYHGICRGKNFLYQTQEYFDPLEMGGILGIKRKENHEKRL